MDSFEVSSLTDQKYIKAMQFLFHGLATASASESKGPLPRDFADETKLRYLEAFREQSPKFKKMTDDEYKQWSVNGTAGNFMKRMKEAMEGVVKETIAPNRGSSRAR